MNKIKFVLPIVVGLFHWGAFADSEGIFLDPPYPNPKPPVVTEEVSPSDFSQWGEVAPDLGIESLAKVSALSTALAQTPVKSQGRRGTCSMFSSTAVLEYQLKHMGVTSEDLDLSEQWLEYITAGQRGQEGSWSYFNFDKYGHHGFLSEDTWRYNGRSWHPYKQEYWDFSASLQEKEIFAAHCEPLRDTASFDGCLIGQLNPQLLRMTDAQLADDHPEFLSWRDLARENLVSEGLKIRSKWVGRSADIQAELDKGEVIALDVTFFYEAWNHRKASEFGLKRDLELWGQGVVSYPHRDSQDYVESRKSDNRAGHSVVIVGYDKEVEITREVLDKNGEPMTVTTKGVYYFKNSWGANSFGVDFVLEETSLPGFGMISMDYAHEHGTFYMMNIQVQ